MNEQTIIIENNLTSRKAEAIRLKLSQSDRSRWFEVQRLDGGPFDKTGFAVVEIVQVRR
jgi:hypothetical protein